MTKEELDQWATRKLTLLVLKLTRLLADGRLLFEE